MLSHWNSITTVLNECGVNSWCFEILGWNRFVRWMWCSFGWIGLISSIPMDVKWVHHCSNWMKINWVFLRALGVIGGGLICCWAAIFIRVCVHCSGVSQWWSSFNGCTTVHNRHFEVTWGNKNFTSVIEICWYFSFHPELSLEDPFTPWREERSKNISPSWWRIEVKIYFL